MTNPARIDLDDIDLRMEHVVERYDLGPLDHKSIRLAICPRCGHKSSSNAISIDLERQTWGHFGAGKREGGNCYGGPLDLLAACAGLDRRREFGKLIALAAEITGVDTSELTDEERESRRIAREQRNAEREAQAALDGERRLREAKIKAAFDWGTMLRDRRDSGGMTYLRRRGLDALALIDGGHLRFDAYGNVAVPLWGLDGELVNVVRRKRGDGEPKVFGLEGCPTAGSLCGRIEQIAPGANTIIAEGVIDTLTAIVKWPGRLVLGAHGAGNLPALAAAAAPRVRDTGGKLVLVPDADDIGKRQMIRAGYAAIDAGLVMDRTLLVVDVAPHRDLNEAHCKGWRL